ncbi:MAG: hypothetical protein EHM39_00035 [Chloroflexi bacterium]|nr:MAG: hypothetical protein EHM39_00035 [Chloroflexota bacterium]
MKRILFFVVLVLLLVPGVALAQDPEMGADPPWAAQFGAFLQLFLSGVAIPALILLTSAGAKWLAAKAQEAKAGLPNELVYTLQHVAQMAVAAAEQSGLAGHIADTAEEKKAWAMQWAENLLKQQFGLVLDLDALGDQWWEGMVDSLDGAIEADVGERNKAFAPEAASMVSANDFRAYS